MDKTRTRRNINHRMVEMEINAVDLAAIMGISKQSVYSRLERLSENTLRELSVILVCPVHVLTLPSPITVVAWGLPDMDWWATEIGPLYRAIIDSGQWPSDADMSRLCHGF